MSMETRFAGALEIRAAGDGYELHGTVMKYSDTARYGALQEMFAPGSLVPADDGVVLNNQHVRSAPLARSPDTMVLVDGPTEMTMTASMPSTSLAGDVVSLVRAKVLRGLSVEFRVVKEQWTGRTRLIKRAILTGLAVVDRAAYPESEVEARSADLERLYLAAQPAHVRGGWRPGL